MNIFLIILTIIMGFPTTCLANPVVFIFPMYYIYKILIFIVILLIELFLYHFILQINYKQITFKICKANFISTLIAFCVLGVIIEIMVSYNMDYSILEWLYIKLAYIDLIKSYDDSNNFILFISGEIIMSITVIFTFILYFYIERAILLRLFKYENSEMTKIINKICFRFNLAIYLIILIFSIIATYLTIY